MSDATLRQVIREHQRAGRLGGLSEGARKCLAEVAPLLTRAVDCNGHLAYVEASTQYDPETHFAIFESTFNPGYVADDVVELGAFLAQLARLL